VEGRHVFTGEVDVIVCDGFTGNVILKVSEGLGEMILAALSEEAGRSTMHGIGLLMAKGAFVNLRRKMDYAEHGGAPLLGVDGACIIGHGRSTAKAIRNAIRVASQYAASGTIEKIAATLPTMTSMSSEENH
jgi:glycerol-3-phosphate acyltransferase PlsX